LAADQTRIEVLVAVGNNPALQRNLSASCASGEVLYFVDDDSDLDPKALRYLWDTLRERPDVAGVGGPSVSRRGDTCTQRSISAAMASVFGLGPVRHRFFPSGRIRFATENELILCNLAIRKCAWARHEGFDPRLYPNEENEYLNRVQDRGERFLYHPLMIASRSPRRNLRQLIAQNFRYGAGRLAHFRVRPLSINAILLLPSMLVAYLALVAVTTAIGFASHGEITLFSRAWWEPQLWFLAPLAAYVNLLVAAAVFGALSLRQDRIRAFVTLLLVFPLIHLSYGSGMIVGRFQARPRLRTPPRVQLYRVKEMGTTASRVSTHHNGSGESWLAHAERLDHRPTPER